MEALGARLAHGLQGGLVVYLHGELGSGKTTLVRGMLHGLGFSGAVKSPTFTLVEPYALTGLVIYHVDLYRLDRIDELETIGIRDYVHERSVLLIEWPERGHGALPDADARVTISYRDTGRYVELLCASPPSEGLCAAVS
jgi:tRNA threonylcarbamoyladenosine biosynthesis protein TsaE